MKEERLRERDREVLKMVSEFGRVDGLFLKRICFEDEKRQGGGAKVSLYRSVKRLKGFGLVHDFKWLNGKKIFAIKDGKKTKRILTQNDIKFFGKRSFSASQMDHDIYVCRAFEAWVSRFKKETPYYMTEKMIKKLGGKFEMLVPDLVFSETQCYSAWYALEIETSIKAIERYQKKIIDYYYLAGARNVVFYCLNKPIENRIRIASRVIDNSSGFIKFKTIEELL
jgi:Fe2+ or Zn2+ uptake regulation protein